MGIETIISKNCTQKAVYWSAPKEDGYGGKTFGNAVELDCRWEEMIQVTTDAKGAEITSRALIFVTQDIDEEGMLYLGTLDDLYDLYGDSSAGEIDDPMSIVGAYIIKRFQKTPSMDGTGYLRKAYLTPSLSFGGF
jgi:hypothetical protein